MGQEDAVEVATAGRVVRATFRGGSVEEDAAEALLRSVRQALERCEGGPTRLVLDFSAVTFINSVGLAACIELRNLVAASGTPTIVLGAAAPVRDLLRMVRVERLFHLVADEEELRRFGGDRARH
jgi:anti-anti-sigma factor